MTIDSGMPPGLFSAITKEFGAITHVTCLSKQVASNTFLVETAQATLVTKRMSYERTPEKFAHLFREMKQAQVPCPELVSAIELKDDWFALFTYEDGYIPNVSDPNWDIIWRQAFDLLAQLKDLTAIVPEWDLESIWLDRFRQVSFNTTLAEALFRRLLASLPNGERTLAHGDLAPQNFLCTDDRLLLLDWEEVGSAHSGFDAGWVLALNRIGAGPRMPQTQLFRSLVSMGFLVDNLRWFEGLGLLRMLYRLLTWPMEQTTFQFLLAGIQNQIESYTKDLPIAP
jgi:aminoglycoside phosphotransferase (APT) family kinase protein